MRITIIGKNLSVSEGVENRVNRKVGKLGRYFREDTEAQVRLSVDKLRNICEITIPVKGGTIRAEEVNENNLFSAIDEAADKLESQIQRYRTRREKRFRSPSLVENVPVAPYEPEPEVSAEEFSIVKEKTFTAYPMTPESAAEQMDLLGHTFFLFFNVESNSICAVYKRHDGNYGLLLPQV